MRLTVLTENTANRRGMLAEHGLSVLVEAGGRRVLFDTGQSDVYVKNAAVLGVSLAGLDGIVLSHGHYDHCDGLCAFPREGGLPLVYVGKGAFHPKRYRSGHVEREVGISWKKQEMERIGYRFRQQEGLVSLFPGMYLLGRIPKLVSFEGVDPGFYTQIESDCCRDGMQDEQMLLVREAGILHVVAGCCHMGIVSSLLWAQQHFPQDRLGMVFAGMHLRGVSKERLTKTIAALLQFSPMCLVPVHCTGGEAAAAMKTAFGSRCVLADAGRVLDSREFEERDKGDG